MQASIARRIPFPNAFHQELLFWWIPLAIIVLIGAVLRLVLLGNDLPANFDPNEPYYFLWAKSIRETGRPDVDQGTGYPPGFLYLLAGEQQYTELIRGSEFNVSVDPFLVARFINGLFGAADILLAGILARQAGKSRLTGLLCAGALATLDLMVTESRRADANAPWLFFTLVSFLLLFEARNRLSWAFLYAALASGVISFLFKYQSGVILGLPFLGALLYLRKSKFLPIHLAIWTVALAALIAWLVFDYRIFEIVHTPASDTASVLDNGRFAGLQSLNTNWRVIAGAAGGREYLWAAVATAVLTILTFKVRQIDPLVDRWAILAYTFFGLAFYLLMAFFSRTAPSKWMVMIAVVLILASTGFVAAIRLIGLGLAALRVEPLRSISAVLPAVCIIGYLVVQLGQQLQGWSATYQNQWAKINTLNELNSWYGKNVPQGGRIISEVNKLVYNYVGAPRIVHANPVASVFDEPITNYRERGYDYLIWTSAKSSETDSLSDLDAKKYRLEQQGAKEVLRLTGSDFTGWDIVVFQVPPYQQYPLYAWFSPAISFRGYDLDNQRFKPGSDIRLMLYWESAEVTQANYAVFVHILDPNTGILIVGQDGPPDYGNTPTWQWGGDMELIRDQRILTVPPDAPPGTYTLRIGMYDAGTQQRVQVSDLNNQPIGDGLVLQQIEIQP